MTYRSMFCLLPQNLIRTIALVALGLVLSTHGALAQGRPEYRDFQLGADLLTVSGLAKVSASEAKTTHVRPALMQDLQWRPPYGMSGSAAPQTDPVKLVVFSFYNDQLFRVVVDYDRERTRGMTAADLIDAISTEYGPPLPPAAAKTRAAVSSLEMESGAPVARWGDANNYLVVLYQSSYASGFRVLVTARRLEALARTAEAQAMLLDEREAPARDIARQKKELDDTRAAQEKARIANKAVFRP